MAWFRNPGETMSRDESAGAVEEMVFTPDPLTGKVPFTPGSAD
jgi:hypothetical protein